MAETQTAPPPALPAELVREFVGVSHGDFARMKELLEQEPRLLNATWDWGGGDFESGVGAAGHMGNREIALYLIGKGARYDVFVAAMLGELEMVEAALAAHPELKDSKGPHGIPLVFHAKAGGEYSAGVVKFLESLS